MASNLGELLVDLRLDSAKLKQGVDECNAKLKGFQEHAEALGRAVAGALSVAVFGEFAKSCVDAFAQSERASKQVENALNQLGYAAQKLAPALREQAEAFKESFGVSDDTVQQVQALLVQFGVAPKDIQKTTQAVLDYSAATGTDAVSSTHKLAASINAGADHLKQMGIAIDDTHDKSQNLAEAVDALEKRFGGSAAAAADTLSGRMAKLNLGVEDLKKGFGGFLANLEAKIGVFDKLAQAIHGVSYALSPEHEGDKRKQAAADNRDQIGDDLDAKLTFRDSLRKQIAAATAGGNKEFAASLKQSLDTVQKQVDDLQKTYDAANQTYKMIAADVNATVPGEDVSQVGQSKEAAAVFGATPAKKGKAASDEGPQWLRVLKDMPSWAQLQEEQERANKQKEEEDARARKEFNDVGAEEAKKQAAFVIKQQDEAAKKAAELFRKQEEAWSRAENALMSFAGSMLGKLGRGGSFISGIVSGAQQGVQIGSAAGPEGAVIGGAVGGAATAVIDLVTSSKGFAHAIQAADAMFQKLSDATGAAFDAARPFIGAVYDLATKGLKPLADAFALTGDAYADFAPGIEALAQEAGTFANLIDAALNGGGSAGPGWIEAGQQFFEAMKAGAMNELTIAKNILDLYDMVIGAFESMLSTVANTDVAGSKPFAGLAGAIASLDKLKVNTDGLSGAIDNLSKLTYGGAMAQAKATAGVLGLYDATAQANGALTNVPQGYRVALARFDAEGGGGIGAQVGGTAELPPANVTFNIYESKDPKVTANHVLQALHQIYRTRSRADFRPIGGP